MNNLEQLIESVRSQVTDPVKKQLLADISVDLVGLITAAANGIDVGKEIQHVNAQAMNLAASEAQIIEDKVTAFIQEMAGKVIVGAFAAL